MDNIYYKSIITLVGLVFGSMIIVSIGVGIGLYEPADDSNMFRIMSLLTLLYVVWNHYKLNAIMEKLDDTETP